MVIRKKYIFLSLIVGLIIVVILNFRLILGGVLSLVIFGGIGVSDYLGSIQCAEKIKNIRENEFNNLNTSKNLESNYTLKVTVGKFQVIHRGELGGADCLYKLPYTVDIIKDNNNVLVSNPHLEAESGRVSKAIPADINKKLRQEVIETLDHYKFSRFKNISLIQNTTLPIINPIISFDNGKNWQKINLKAERATRLLSTLIIEINAEDDKLLIEFEERGGVVGQPKKHYKYLFKLENNEWVVE